MKKILLLVLVLALVSAGLRQMLSSGDSDAGLRSVQVERGSIVVEAVAVGRLEARFEVPVTSTSGGVVTQRFVELGQRVKRGDPLLEVRPVLTDLQALQAERALLGAREAEAGVVEMKAGETIAGMAMRMIQGGKSLERMERGAKRARSDAEEQLELLLNGKAEIDGKIIDYVIRAPIDGHVIALDVEVGEPVVPSSSFGSGTALLVLADLDHPVFRGTVDELDVGRLREGMAAELTVGARPDDRLRGELTEISLKATSRNNAVIFDVELSVVPPSGFVMRSGYSAVARIRVEEAQDVLLLPERVIDFRGGVAFVQQLDTSDEVHEVEVEVGLSNGMTVEILSGLEDQESVLERSF
jgi:HlyD family secretion protein